MATTLQRRGATDGRRVFLHDGEIEMLGQPGRAPVDLRAKHLEDLGTPLGPLLLRIDVSSALQDEGVGKLQLVDGACARCVALRTAVGGGAAREEEREAQELIAAAHPSGLK